MNVEHTVKVTSHNQTKRKNSIDIEIFHISIVCITEKLLLLEFVSRVSIKVWLGEMEDRIWSFSRGRVEYFAVVCTTVFNQGAASHHLFFHHFVY